MPGFVINGTSDRNNGGHGFGSNTLAKVEPAFSHRWRVEFGGIGSNNGPSMTDYALSCQRPSYSFEVVEMPYKSTSIYAPGKLKWETVTIVFYEILGDVGIKASMPKTPSIIDKISSKIDSFTGGAFSTVNAALNGINGGVGGKFTGSADVGVTGSSSTTNSVFNRFVNNNSSGYNYSDNRLNTEYLISTIKIFLDDGGPIESDQVDNGIITRTMQKIIPNKQISDFLFPNKYAQNPNQLNGASAVYTLYNAWVQSVKMDELNYSNSKILTTAITFRYDSAAEGIDPNTVQGNN